MIFPVVYLSVKLLANFSSRLSSLQVFKNQFKPGFINRPVTASGRCDFVLKRVILAQNWKYAGTLKWYLNIFWLNEPNCLKTDRGKMYWKLILINSKTCPIICQSDPLLAQTWYPCFRRHILIQLFKENIDHYLQNIY